MISPTRLTRRWCTSAGGVRTRTTCTARRPEIFDLVRKRRSGRHGSRSSVESSRHAATYPSRNLGSIVGGVRHFHRNVHRYAWTSRFSRSGGDTVPIQRRAGVPVPRRGEHRLLAEDCGAGRSGGGWPHQLGLARSGLELVRSVRLDAPLVVPGEFDEDPTARSRVAFPRRRGCRDRSSRPISQTAIRERWTSRLACRRIYISPLDGPDGIQNFSKDLAFELYTIPEPASLALMGLGALALVGCRCKRRN